MTDEDECRMVDALRSVQALLEHAITGIPSQTLDISGNIYTCVLARSNVERAIGKLDGLCVGLAHNCAPISRSNDAANEPESA